MMLTKPEKWITLLKLQVEYQYYLGLSFRYIHINKKITLGGKVLTIRNTETYPAGKRKMFGIPFCDCEQQNTPQSIIQVFTYKKQKRLSGFK